MAVTSKNLGLNKNDWTRVALGEVATASKERVDPTSGQIDRYVAGEHMDTDDLKIRRWGEVGNDYLGPAFHRRFRPGQVLYGSRRTYLRKVAVPDFDGVTSNTTFAISSRNERRLLQSFLPFVMSSEAFHSFAIKESKGSVNPYVNWTDIERFKFLLPPLAEQEQLSKLLWCVEQDARASSTLLKSVTQADESWTRKALGELDWSLPLRDVIRTDRALCYGVVQPGVELDEGVGLIRVVDLESGSPDFASLKKIAPAIDWQYRRSKVESGDVIVSIVGTIGRSWVVTNEFDGCNIARALARLAPEPSVMSARFLHWTLNSSRAQEALFESAFESARRTLNLSALAEIKLPRVSLAEQDAIMQAHWPLSSGASVVRELRTTRERLRAAVLAEIFGGPGEL